MATSTDQKKIVKLTVQLRRQGGDDVSNSLALAQRRVHVNIISHTFYDNGTTANDNGGDDENNNTNKYIMCSLLLQLGKVLGVSPSYAPTPKLSSIFNKIIEKWSLQHYGGNNNNMPIRNMDEISDMNDGDELVLCCGDYAKDSSSSSSYSLSTTNEVDLLALLPCKYKNVVTVSRIAATTTTASSLEKEGEETTADKNNGHSSNFDNDDSDDDDDSDIEDVTDSYVSPKKPRASPEIINVDEIDSDDDGDESESCFWEYDEYGNMKRSKTAHDAKSLRKSRNNNESGRNEDIESINSDDSDSSSGVEDVTATMLAQRKEQAQKMIDGAEEINDDSNQDEDDDDNQKVAAGTKRKRKPRSQQSTAKRRKTKKKVESSIEVLIDEKDVPDCPGAKTSREEDGGSNTSNSEKVDHTIKQRIIKLLNTGFHDDSNEHEARNAMKLARRLMERYNLDQAVLLQERGDGSLNDFSTANGEDSSSLQGGIVTAKIRNRKRGKPLSSLPRWHDFLVKPVCLNFHVEAFKTVARSTPLRVGECSVTFYGIRTNAQLAAYAFKIASERIALMAATYEPTRRKMLPTAKQVGETRTARLSYALGIVNGLERDVKEGLRKEEEIRKEKLRKAQRAAKTGGEAYHEDGDSDSGGERGSSCAQSDDSRKMAAEDVDHPKISHDESSSNAAEQLGKLERENSAHLALVDHHKKIASDVLKTKNIKVRSARKHKSISLNRKAYEKGVIDSKEIDLNQQAII